MGFVEDLKEKVKKARDRVTGRIRDTRPFPERWRSTCKGLFETLESMYYLEEDGVSGEEIDKKLKAFLERENLKSMKVTGRIKGWKFIAEYSPAPHVFSLKGKIHATKGNKEITIVLNPEQKLFLPIPSPPKGKKYIDIIGGALDAYLKTWIHTAAQAAAYGYELEVSDFERSH